MNLRTYLESHINSLRFLKFFKQNNKQNELVELALKERGMLFKLMQNLTPELIQDQEVTNNPISKKDIILILEANLKISFYEHFQSLSEAVFCASIGQVHKAKLKNGATVAIKVQYPNVKTSINSQLNLLKVAALGTKLSKIAKWNIDINSHIAMIEERLSEELNYLHELNNLIKFKRLNPNCAISIYNQYSSPLVLTQSWINGISLMEVKKKWQYDQRKIIANLLVEQYFKHVFLDGFFQGDNNFSNFIISENPIQLHWIDFGNWITSPEKLRQSLIVLIHRTINKSEINFLGHFTQMGFDLQKLKYFQNIIPNLLEILFDPFLVDRPFDIQNWKLDERIEYLLGKNKWWFRSSGDSSFLELMKSFIGLVKVIEYLEVNINWHSHFLKIGSLFDMEKIESLIPMFPNSIPQPSELARHLLIQVFKDSHEHVRIELPASSFFELENFVPDDVKSKLEARSLNISEIKFSYLENGLVPGKVFDLADGTNIFQVHLT